LIIEKLGNGRGLLTSPFLFIAEVQSQLDMTGMKDLLSSPAQKPTSARAWLTLQLEGEIHSENL